MINIKKCVCACVFIVLVGGYYSYFIYESDPFLSDVRDSAWRNERDFSHLLLDYIPLGSSVSEVLEMLELKGFKVRKTDPGEWGSIVESMDEKYVARLEWRSNPVMLVKVVIVLVVVNEKIYSMSGKSYFTSI